MASLYKRRLKSGEVWYGQVRLRDGRWKTFNTHCPGRREAKDVVAGIEAEIAAGRDPFHVESNGVGDTISGVANRYFDACARSWSRSTLVSRQHTVRIVTEVLADRPLETLTRDDISQFRDHLIEHLSPHSVNIHLRNLRALMNWAARELFPEWRPPSIAQVKAPGAEHRDSLTPDELQSVLAASEQFKINGESITPFIAFLAWTGLRRGEALSAEWEWIQDAFILVPAGRTKSGQARAVPLTAPVKKLLAERPEPHTGRIFSAMNEKVTKLFPKAVQAAGITRHLKLHNLRDTFIITALNAGVPLPVVSQIVGHSDIRITIRSYGRFGNSELQEAAKRISRTNSTTNLLRTTSSD
ncbi:MAG: tyrosine-type recombinase/integrase [Calditrichota bacterium]